MYYNRCIYICVYIYIWISSEYIYIIWLYMSYVRTNTNGMLWAIRISTKPVTVTTDQQRYWFNGSFATTADWNWGHNPVAMDIPQQQPLNNTGQGKITHSYNHGSQFQLDMWSSWSRKCLFIYVYIYVWTNWTRIIPV